ALALKALWPAEYYACLSGQDVSVVDHIGEQVREEMAHIKSALRQAAGGVDSITEQNVVAAPLVCRGRSYGAVALALSKEQVAADAGLARDTLQEFASHAAVRLALKDACAASDPDRTAWLDNVSELTSVLTHEFNNILNGMLLHIAVLRQSAATEVSADLE